MLRDIAIIVLLIIVRLAWVHFRPYRECRWCRRGGLIGGSWLAALAGRTPRRTTRTSCWRCNRTRLTRRWGARHTHRLVLSLRQARAEWRRP